MGLHVSIWSVCQPSLQYCDITCSIEHKTWSFLAPPCGSMAPGQPGDKSDTLCWNFYGPANATLLWGWGYNAYFGWIRMFFILADSAADRMANSQTNRVDASSNNCLETVITFIDSVSVWLRSYMEMTNIWRLYLPKIQGSKKKIDEEDN